MSDQPNEIAHVITAFIVQRSLAASDATASSAEERSGLRMPDADYTRCALEAAHLFSTWLDMMAYRAMEPADRRELVTSVLANLTHVMTNKEFIDDARYLVYLEAGPRLQVASYNPNVRDQRAQEYARVMNTTGRAEALVSTCCDHALPDSSRTIETEVYADRLATAMVELASLLEGAGVANQLSKASEPKAPGTTLRLTRDEHPSEIEQFKHIKPAPTFGPTRCFAQFPNRHYSCTLAKGHAGPHVAHTWFKKVVAVWN